MSRDEAIAAYVEGRIDRETFVTAMASIQERRAWHGLPRVPTPPELPLLPPETRLRRIAWRVAAFLLRW